MSFEAGDRVMDQETGDVGVIVRGCTESDDVGCPADLLTMMVTGPCTSHML